MVKANRVVFLVIATLIISMISCGTKIETATPSITINLPVDGSTLKVGETVEIVSTASGEAGIAQVELSIDGEVMNIASPSQGNPTTFAAIQTWLPDSQGNFRITVRAKDVQGKESEAASMDLVVIAEMEATVTPTLLPHTPSHATPPTPATGTPEPCTLDATLLEDITIPDRKMMHPDETFTKIWRIKNSGTCPWPRGTVLAYSKGDHFPGPAIIPVPAAEVDEVVDINFEITMPEFPEPFIDGFRWLWLLTTEDNEHFGPDFIVSVSFGIRPTLTYTPTITHTKTPIGPTPTMTPYFTPTYTPQAEAQIQRIINQVALSPNEMGQAEVSCPENSIVTSGGFSTHPDVLIYTHSKSRNGWQAYGVNNDASEKLLTVYATCLSNSPGSISQIYAQTVAMAGSLSQGSATCPAGSVVTGGGWASNAESGLSVYNSSKSGNGWQVYVQNTSEQDTFFNTYAICLSGTNGTTRQRGENVSLAAGSTGAVKAVCEGDELITGGGFAADKELYVYDTSLEKGSSSTWWAYAINPSGTTQLLSSYAICLSFP